MSDRPTAGEIAAEYAACPYIPGDPVELADRAHTDAMDLAADVRELDPRQLWGRLTIWATEDPARLFAATVALAAMVDVDQPAAHLLAWTTHLDTTRDTA
ncbi:hypothetical protein [Actinokineospora spheciospongiae]|uniref:hypothetical protein n=1 Tax=Actinokineospora spheciospongiae TaxID=909613 RepID=UPI000D71420D|nr:hypothetical protein [Actinokineospora spheciospongiae]PWW50249.1 hypothetical protein DFQ13_12311 [Actinokineospora spheciospongiae]